MERVTLGDFECEIAPEGGMNKLVCTDEKNDRQVSISGNDRIVVEDREVEISSRKNDRHAQFEAENIDDVRGLETEENPVGIVRGNLE